MVVMVRYRKISCSLGFPSHHLKGDFQFAVAFTDGRFRAECRRLVNGIQVVFFHYK